MKRNPFVGLRPYSTEEASIFHGREKEVENLLEIIQKNKLTAIVGPPGSGKTSLINAGLIPRLQNGFLGQAGDQWAICKFRPGIAPLENLCYSLVSNGALTADNKANTNDYKSFLETLRSYGKMGVVEIYKNSEIFNKKNLLIIIDQLEDIFRFSRYFDHEVEGDDDILLDIVSRSVQVKETSIYFLISVKSGYSGELAQYIRLQEIISKSQYAIQNLGVSGVQEIIKKNFKANHIHFDLNSLEYVQDKINSDLSLLPNAQYLFYCLYKECLQKATDEKSISVTMKMLEELGGVENSLGKGLEKFYKGLSDSEKDTFKRIIKASMNFENVKNSQQYETISKISQYSELGTYGVSKFIKKLKESFDEAYELIPPKITGVAKQNSAYDKELIFSPNYESHLTWNLKEEWVEEEFKAFNDFKEFSDAAKKHQQNKGSLLIDPALKLASAWKEKLEINASWARKYSFDFKITLKFIEKSLQSAQEKIEIEKNRRKRVKQTNKYFLYVGVLIVLMLAISTWYQSNLKQDAKESQKKALREQRKAVNESRKNERLILEANTLSTELKEISDSLKVKFQESERKSKEIEKQRDRIKIQSEKNLAQANKIRNKQAEVLEANDRIKKAKGIEEKRKTFAQIESEFSELKSDLLYDFEFTKADGNQDRVNNSVKRALEKYRQYKELSLELDGENDDSSDLYLMLQTALGILEGKEKYINTSMRLNKTTNDKSSIRSMDTYGDGLVVFGGDDGKINMVLTEGKAQNIITNFNGAQIRKVVILNDNEMLIGTVKGEVYRIDIAKKITEKVAIGETTSPIRNIINDLKNNSIIVISDTELIEKKGTEIKRIKTDISASYYDNEHLFFASGSKLYFYKSGSIIPVQINQNTNNIKTITAIESVKNKLFIGTNSGEILIFTAPTSWEKSSAITYENRVRSHKTRITKLLFDQKDGLLFSASLDNQVFKHNLNIKNQDEDYAFRSLRLIGHEKWVWDLSLVQDRNKNGKPVLKLITADENGNLLSWYVNQDDLAGRIRELAKGI